MKLSYISAITILIPFIALLISYRRLTFEMKLLGILFFIGTLSEFASLLISMNRTNNMFVLNTYSFIEALILFTVLGKWFESEKLFRITMSLFLVFFIVWIYETFIAGSFSDFNSDEKSIKGIMLILLSGYFLIWLSLKEEIVIWNNYKFWAASAVLVYFSVNFIVFATVTALIKSNPGITNYTWIIHSIINITANLLFAISFICYYREKKSYS